MGKSQSFKDEKPVRVHLLKSRGRGGEITDLRNDIDEAFYRLEQSGGIGGVTVLDEGTVVLTGVTALNFIGADVLASDPSIPGQVNIFIPTPTFLSHWNTSDGANGDQSVVEGQSRTSAHISAPAGGEGTPFNTGGWAGTDQDAATTAAVGFTTPANTTGFGGDSTATINVYDADGVSLLETYTTPVLDGVALHNSPSGNITVAITGYGPDSLRFQAKMAVTVNIGAILTNAGLAGGRYHVAITHDTDSATDGSSHTYTQSDVFLDANPTTPSISGAVTIAETGGGIQTKHLSGLEYYVLNSQFTANIIGIDDLNENTSRVDSNLVLNGAEYGLATLNQCPFGAGAGSFTGWTNNHDVAGVGYTNTTWAISQANYRYMGPTANIVATPQDPWAAGGSQLSANALVLIDTWTITSTDLFEGFDDEARREDPASFPGAGTWVSSNALLAGEAQQYDSYLLVPNTTTYVRSDGPSSPNADWTLYKPDVGGANPDYSALGAPVDYGRRFTQAPGLIPSFTIVFSGVFAAGDALADLIAGNLEVYVYRIDAPSGGNFGPPPGNTFPLRVHEPFNLAFWDDGVTVPGSGIREGSSVGNTINCTFGPGTPASIGFYGWVRIINPGTQLDSMSVTFV